MKKYLYILLIGIGGALGFQSCQDDPVFPDPGFDIADQRVEVRRDTADYYNISMEMEVPNGVKVIELINAVDYTILEEINEFNGLRDFLFTYEVDLTQFETDTVLNYIVKVIDNDSRSFNQGIRISVKRLSYPEIKLVGGNNLAVAAPAYIVKGLVSTGLNALESISIQFEGEEQYFFSPVDTTIYEMTLKQLVFLGDMQTGQDYVIDIVIADETGQVSTTKITLHKTDEIKHPYRIYYTNYNSINYTINLEYEEGTDRLSWFEYIFPTGSSYTNNFYYNEAGMLDSIIYRSVSSEGTYSYDKRYRFTYTDGTTELASLELQEYDYDDLGQLISESEVEVLADGFVYREDGSVELFYYEGTKIADVTYSDPFNLGETIFSEYWQTASYAKNSSRRQQFVEYDPVLMPTYVEGFPQFYMDNSIMLNVYRDLLWNKYMPLETVGASDYAYLYTPVYQYETDNDGNITTILKTIIGGNYSTAGKMEIYTFLYE